MQCLTESIEHWERLLAACESRDADALSQEGHGVYSCACCDEFYDNGWCTGCPVYEYTGKTICVNTPYGKAADAFNYILSRGSSNSLWLAAVEAATLELNFLKELNKCDTK